MGLWICSGARGTGTVADIRVSAEGPIGDQSNPRPATAMTQPAGHYLASFNFGTLRYPWDDPRVKDFQDNLDRVNAIGARSPGFVWRLDDDAMEAAQEDSQGPLADHPNTASTLSVWETPRDLWQFVHNTLHGRFLARAGEWFVPGDSGYFVGWWVPTAHRPTVAEGMAMWRQVQAAGDSDAAFGAARLRVLAA